MLGFVTCKFVGHYDDTKMTIYVLEKFTCSLVSKHTIGKVS